ncbi:unnamed protein product [Staurois parvus]|uniref:Uncharacterized protein n=1 Tax=Staurois parvus TaxID=386267 RepID=A0ABN9DGK8_9NEOB|nr:unnamed protein product [Staurois parvus]
MLIGPVLITCTLPRKKNSLAIHTKLSTCRVTPHNVLSGDKRGTLEEGEDQGGQDQSAFFTQYR